MSDPRRWTVPGARESARIAWRARVNAAARDWMTSGARTLWLSLPWHPRKPYSWRLHDALTAPRPWRSSRRPDPRRRYSRAHRRACWRCRVAHLWMHPSILRLVRDLRAYPEWDAGSEWSYVARFERLTRDPHGRRS